MRTATTEAGSRYVLADVSYFNPLFRIWDRKYEKFVGHIRSSRQETILDMEKLEEAHSADGSLTII